MNVFFSWPKAWYECEKHRISKLRKNGVRKGSGRPPDSLRAQFLSNFKICFFPTVPGDVDNYKASVTAIASCWRRRCMSSRIGQTSGRMNDASGPTFFVDFRPLGAHGEPRELWDGLRLDK